VLEQLRITAVSGWASERDASKSTWNIGSKELSASEFHSAQRFIKTDQGRIAYVEKGKGPAALFLHGFPLNSFQWRGVIPRLSEHRQCIAPDFSGLGYTEVANGQSVAPASQVAMIAGLLDKLSIPSLDVIANDNGSAVAQLFVARYARRVRSLLLTNCDTEHDCPPAAVLPVIELARRNVRGRVVSSMVSR
jgi:pimeloyl-ACP methyl ester carboxylesterase